MHFNVWKVIYLDFLKTPSARARRAYAPSALGMLGFSRFRKKKKKKLWARLVGKSMSYPVDKVIQPSKN